jgi:hypothetical protein
MELGWIRVDLSKLYQAHRTYEPKRKRLQGLASGSPRFGRCSGSTPRGEEPVGPKSYVSLLKTT